MFNQPWLQKFDQKWQNLTLWNLARELFFTSWDNIGEMLKLCQRFTEIEEAQWFARFNLHDRGLPRQLIIEVLTAAAVNDDRAATYMAIMRKDTVAIEHLAYRGNPIAQTYHVTMPRQFGVNENNSSKCEWLEKSMASGYSEAFYHRAQFYLVDDRDAGKRLTCLQRGIEHGSIKCISAYVELPQVRVLDKLYWLGRAWTISTSRHKDFITMCDKWLQDFKNNRDYASRGFVLGVLFDHQSEKLTDRLRNAYSDFSDEVRVLKILKHEAHPLYQKMCTATERAVWTWIFVAKQLKVCRDIRTVIAKLIWNTRSDSAWHQV